LAEQNQHPNYPDILGYITGGGRYNVNVAQVALAVRPRVVRAGRPFEAILLIQNASDSDVDITATLQIPEQDAKRQKNRFRAKSMRLVVGLRPAEVGYVVLPLSSLPDTAVSDQYKVGMAVEVKPLAKPRRIRLAEGGGAVNLEYLSDETLAKINDLKKLSFSTTRRGLIGSVIEAPFHVLSAQVGQLVDLSPGWVSLWRMSDYRDDRLLLERYGSALAEKVLPKLKAQTLYPAMFRATGQRLRAAGYDIHPIEAHYIAKLLVTVLESAAPEEETIDPLIDGKFNVKRLLKNGTNDPNALPGWCRGLLKAIDKDPSAAENPALATATTVYDELLRDAIPYGFQLLAKTTGEDLGSVDEVREYAERLTNTIMRRDKPLTFTDVYLPLVLGGVVIYDKALSPDEKVGEALSEMLEQLEARRSEVNPDTELVYQMGEQVLDRALQKYGYRA
jgi:hypothetical protein